MGKEKLEFEVIKLVGEITPDPDKPHMEMQEFIAVDQHGKEHGFTQHGTKPLIARPVGYRFNNYS